MYVLGAHHVRCGLLFWLVDWMLGMQKRGGENGYIAVVQFRLWVAWMR